MIVWVWDAYGPDSSGHGVTDDETAAVRAAEAYMKNKGANVAKVEAAQVMLGAVTLASVYVRTGQGRHGRSGESGIRWGPLAELAAS